MTGTVNDHDLAGWLKQRLGRRHPVAAAALVSPTGVRTAVVGAPAGSDFEIGSISKGVTGLLYADAIARGEVSPESTLGALLPLGEVPAAPITLSSLSTHSSGLPGLPPSAQVLRRTLRLWRSGTNPYGESLDELMRQARSVKPGAPRSRYSNFGFELLGHAVASGAAIPFQQLLADRIATPLGLTSVYAPSAADRLRPTSLLGRSRRGRPMQPWTGEAIAPAGGIRASIGDMAALTRALLEGTAPGMAALDPVRRFGGAVEIGAAWITLEVKGRPVTWHNGGTGGFRSWMGLDRGAGTAVVLLSATSVSVDRFGFELLRTAQNAG